MANHVAMAMPFDPSDIEATLRRRFDAGDLRGTLALAIKRYGSELYGFLRRLTKDTVRADDLFAITCERVWRFLPTFRWNSTFRVWAYTVARNEFLRDVGRPRRETSLGDASFELVAAPDLEQVDDLDRLARLRQRLPPDDHVLLGLRLDRELSWSEIAKVLAGDGAGARDAAMLRKRYERLTTRLRELAQADAA